MVWNSKTYLDKPLIVKEDNLILKHRRWYSQFYSKKNGKKSDEDSYSTKKKEITHYDIDENNLYW